MNQKKNKEEKRNKLPFPKIIFEDRELLIINKPAGWIVNDSLTSKNQYTIQSWLKNNFTYENTKSDLMRSGIVHRLDKETSGILLIAKTENSFRDLQLQFKSRRVKKSYTALVHGNTKSDEGIISEPVGRLPWNRERFGVLPGGREAETRYKKIGVYKLASSEETFSLLDLFPKTGRTHQIRIHLKHIGNPIVADQFYAGRKTSKKDRSWCPRLFLHAKSISFENPVTGKAISFEVSLPPDLKSALSRLEKIPANELN